MGRNSFEFFVPAMLRKLKRFSMGREPGFLGLASVCSCATSSGVHKLRKITRKFGNSLMNPFTRCAAAGGFVPARRFGTLGPGTGSHAWGSGEAWLVLRQNLPHNLPPDC